MGATDCSCLRVIDWGYYLVTVINDHSCHILAWELNRDMTAGSPIDAVKKAVDITGMNEVPVKERTSLLSDDGEGYVSKTSGDYLRVVDMDHLLASAFHPRTDGKVERYQKTLKRAIDKARYQMPSELRRAIESFVEYHNHQR